MVGEGSLYEFKYLRASPEIEEKGKFTKGKIGTQLAGGSLFLSFDYANLQSSHLLIKI